jgi:predicted ester cyclase
MTTKSTPEQNKEVVRRYIEECINAGNMALVDEFFVPERANLVRQFHAGDGSGGPFPDGIEEIKDLVAEGNKVMARWIFRATQTGEIWGIPPTGKAIEVTGYAVYYFRDGKIEWDTMSIEWTDAIEQLGARIVPPEPQPA